LRGIDSVGAYDARRSEVEKNERYRLLELPDDLFDALLATLPPREVRDLEAPLFPDLNDNG